MSASEKIKLERERAGFETIEDLLPFVHWKEATYRSWEDGTRPVTDVYLAKVLGSIREGRRRRDWSDERVVRDAESVLNREFSRQQARALGKQLAASLWNAGGDDKFCTALLNEVLYNRSDKELWTERNLLFAAAIALQELAYEIGKRDFIRDGFHPEDPLVQVVP